VPPVIHPIPDRLKRAHAASLAALTAVEANAKTKLHASARRVVRAVAPTPTHAATVQALTAMADELEEALTDDVVLVRSAARGMSAETLADELHALDEEAVFDLDSDEYIDEDEAAGTATGKGLSAAWLALALLVLSRKPNATAKEAGDEALAEMGWKIDGASTTEVAAAFNREREASLARRRYTGLYKRWDASLDLKTCERCHRLNGTTVPAHHSFPGGAVPGLIHRSCRCAITLVPAYLVGNP
jgi:hypothetical protein